MCRAVHIGRHQGEIKFDPGSRVVPDLEHFHGNGFHGSQHLTAKRVADAHYGALASEGLHVFVLLQQLRQFRGHGLFEHLAGTSADEILQAQPDFRQAVRRLLAILLHGGRLP